MFEGLLSPWHLLIIALAIFVVIGPKALADRWKNLSETVGRLGDPPDGGPLPPAAADEPAPPAEPRSPLARRIGRRLTRRRRHRSGR